MMASKKTILNSFDIELEEQDWFVKGMILGIFTGLLGNISIAFLMRWLDGKPYSEFGFLASFLLLIGFAFGMYYAVHYTLPKNREKIINALIERYKKT